MRNLLQFGLPVVGAQQFSEPLRVPRLGHVCLNDPVHAAKLSEYPPGQRRCCFWDVRSLLPARPQLGTYPHPSPRIGHTPVMSIPRAKSWTCRLHTAPQNEHAHGKARKMGMFRRASTKKGHVPPAYLRKEQVPPRESPPMSMSRRASRKNARAAPARRESRGFRGPVRFPASACYQENDFAPGPPKWNPPRDRG